MLVGSVTSRGTCWRVLIVFGSALALSGCVPTGPDPSIVGPMALQQRGELLRIAFCEEVSVGAIRVSQRLHVDGEPSDWTPLFDADLVTVASRLETLELRSDAGSTAKIDGLHELSSQPGTQFYVAIEDGLGGGFGGQFEVPAEGWSQGSWLPTGSEPTTTPCEFWDEWTN